MITDVTGLKEARNATEVIVWMGIAVQLSVSLAIVVGLYGFAGFKLRKGVDRTIIWYIALSSVGWVLQDLNNLAINVNQPYFFGMDCSSTSRFTSLVSALGCVFTYLFLLKKSQNVQMKHNLSNKFYRAIYAVIAAFVAVSVIFSSIAFRSEAQVDGVGLCIYQGENNGVSVLLVSFFMGTLNYAAEFLCLYIFVNPLRKLEADIKAVPTGEGFHLRELQTVINKNLRATWTNIIGSGICAMAVAFAVFVSPRASDQVYAVITYVIYGFLSTGGLIYCTFDAWTTSHEDTGRKASSVVKSNGSGAKDAQPTSAHFSSGRKASTVPVDLAPEIAQLATEPQQVSVM
jgi:hypothetical protein